MRRNSIAKQLSWVYRVSLIFIALTFVESMVMAQSNEDLYECCGVVKDKKTGIPLEGVSVYCKIQKNGTATNSNGEFTLKLPVGKHEFFFSYIGYEEEKKLLECRKVTKPITVFLTETSSSLQEVVVVGKSKEQRMRESTIPVSVIPAKDLQGTVSNANEILAKTVGVTVRNGGGEGSSARISVRGLEGKRIGVFVDGRPMNENSDYADINDFPLDMIERIEIYKGIVPAWLGGSSVGGAINIVLKEFPPGYYDIAYGYSSFNTHKFNSVIKHNEEKLGLLFGIGIGYTYSDNNYMMDSPYYDNLKIKRNHDQYKKLLTGFGMKAFKWWFDEVEIEMGRIHNQKQIQGIEYDIRQAHTDTKSYMGKLHLDKTDFLLMNLDLKSDFMYSYGNTSFVDTATIRYQFDGTPFPCPSPYGGEVGRYPSHAQNRKHGFMSKINLNYMFAQQHTLNFNSLFNYAYGIPKDDVRDAALGYKNSFDTHMTSATHGLSYEYKTRNNRLMNVLAAKHYFYNTHTTVVNPLNEKERYQQIHCKKHDFGVSESLRYRLFPSLFLKGSFSYDVRLPSEEELLGDGWVIEPSTNLTPEHSKSTNIGLIFNQTNSSGNNFQMELNGFYTYLTDMIRFVGGPIRSHYENFGEMKMTGIEYEMKVDINRWLYGYGNITYQDLRDTRKYEPLTQNPNPTKGNRMPNIPFLMMNGGLEFHKENLFGGKGQNTRIMTDFSYIHEYYYDFKQSNYQERKIPTSFTVNLGIEHSLWNERLFISGYINNLTNAKIMSEFNRPLPGRNFGLKIRYVHR